MSPIQKTLPKFKKKNLDAKGKKSNCQFRKSHKVIHEKRVFESTLGQPIQ